MTGISGYFAFALVLASSLLSSSQSEANFFSSSSNVYLNTIESSSTSIDNNIYSSAPLSDDAEEVARRRSLAANILLLLGTEDQKASVNLLTAEMISSCFKFFVTPTSSNSAAGKFIWSAPQLIKDLAKEAANYNGDSRYFIHRYLNQEKQRANDAGGTWANGQQIRYCNLAGQDYGQSFQENEYDTYFIVLFHFIADHAREQVGSTVKLDRYDLHHGHMFLANGRIGILFHTQEYPKPSATFPDTEKCQGGNNWMVYNQANMSLRNILWLAPLVDNTGGELAPGVLVALNASTAGIIYRDLVINAPRYQKKAFTIFERDFGDDAGEVDYFNVKRSPQAADEYKFYFCKSGRDSPPGVTSE